MKLYFVRHGESEANTLHIISNRDLPHGLTDTGRQQAAELAHKFEGIPITRIFSSPILRAAQTAEILSQALGAPVKISDALREFDCGVLEGESSRVHWDDYGRVFRDWQAGKWDSCLGGGESLLDIQARFVPFVGRLKRDYGEAENILLVSHGGTLLGVLPILLENVDHTFAFAHLLSNADVVIAESTLTGWVCLSWCGEQLPISNS